MAQNYTLDEIKARILSIGSKASKIKWLTEEAGYERSDAEHTYRLIMMLNPEAEAASRVANARAIHFTMGVEIECINVNRNEVRRLCTERGIETRDDYNAYNHRDSENTYKLMSDASLRSDGGDAYGTCEIVTPILRNLNSLKTVCEVINEAGARVNKTCGLHVHFGAKDFTDAQWFRIICNYGRIEEIIDSFMPASRRGANPQWCASVKEHARNLERRAERGERITFRECRYEIGGRYHKVNLEAFDRHRTIEFRQHSGTTNFTKIENWVKFLASFLTYSIRNERLIEATSIDELPFLNASQKAYFKNRAENL